MTEQLLLVPGQPVQATIQPVLVRHGVVHGQQLVHRAAVEPLAVQPILAARGDQPVHHQQLQHLLPRHLAGNVLEPLRPEPLQPQLLPQPTAQPAVPERPWPPQLHRRQPHLYAVQGVGRNRPVLREQTQLSALLPALVEDLQTLPPCRLLRIVDLAQIQDGSLHDLAAGHPAVLDDAEVAMRFAVLPPILASQEHGPIFGPLPIPINTVGLHYSGFDAPYDGTTETYARKFLRKWQKDARRAKVGLIPVSLPRQRTALFRPRVLG